MAATETRNTLSLCLELLLLEERASRFHRAANVLFGVRRRNKSCLELRRSNINTPLQQKVEELPEPRRIALLRRLPIRDRVRGKEKRKHRPDAIDRHARRSPSSQLRRASLEQIVDLRMSHQMPQYCQT